MNDIFAKTHRRFGPLRMPTHPVLYEPELAASAADVILAGRIEHPGAISSHEHLIHKISGELALTFIRRGNRLITFTDNRYRGLPYPWIEPFQQTLYVLFAVVLIVYAVIEERLPAGSFRPTFTLDCDLRQ